MRYSHIRISMQTGIDRMTVALAGRLEWNSPWGGQMLRRACVALFCVLPLFSQPKKILVAYNNPDLVEKLRATGPEVKVVPVTQDDVMNEIADADAFVGEITSAQVRAAKNLKW